MKASKLIKALQEKIDQWGDLEVTYDSGACQIEYVDDYYADKETIKERFGDVEPFFEVNW